MKRLVPPLMTMLPRLANVASARGTVPPATAAARARRHDMRMTYLKNGETLRYDSALCTGCKECVEVCPHAVFAMADGKAAVVDRGACMECGACMKNCAAGAIRVTAGVGCAAAVLQGMLRGTEPTCGCSGDSPLPVAAAKGSKSCCN